MSDSRFLLKVEFEIYGSRYTWAPSLNYSDNGDGMDDRITEFFETSYRDAYGKVQSNNCEADRRTCEAKQKADDLATLAALREKYPDA